MPIQTVKDLIYADCCGRVLRLDLHLPEPASQSLPVIVRIFGGGWYQACQDAPPWLTEHGFAVASIDYRLSGEAIAPANIHDCKAAVRWLRANAKAYRLDPNRIGAFGHSAGGHLAALLGLSQGVAELEGHGGNEGWSSAVQAVCDCCGPSDLTRIAKPEVRQRFAAVYQATARYLGRPVEERLELARLISPLTYVSPSAPPMLICHGSGDTVVAVEESEILAEALKKVGADVTLRVLNGAGHGWDRQLTQGDIVSFFRRTLN